MTALFADTFYWIALTDFNDSAHQQALTLALNGLVTSSSQRMKC